MIDIDKLIGADKDRPKPLTAEKLDRALQGAVMFVKGSAQMFENWAESIVPTTNEMAAADQAYCQAIGGDPNIYFGAKQHPPLAARVVKLAEL